jgi:hypothetical protein
MAERVGSRGEKGDISLNVGHHRGSIRLELEVGVGTTLVVTIPCAGPACAPTEAVE